ncbi:MAG: GNAT family N-acetyltransferase [Phycisphaerales bacterium]|nr:GNAT family N-acetyltransferase [Phycisphaerales bacterium]
MQPEQLLIRRAGPADAPTLVAFNCALAHESEGRRLDPAVVSRGVARVLSNPALGVYYLAERGGTVVGQLMVTFELSDWRDGVFWWIQSVYVAPAARRLGVYRRLHEAVAADARRSGDACGVRLYVDADNTRAQAVYERLGMKRTAYYLYETDWSQAGG